MKREGIHERRFDVSRRAVRRPAFFDDWDATLEDNGDVVATHPTGLRIRSPVEDPDEVREIQRIRLEEALGGRGSDLMALLAKSTERSKEVEAKRRQEKAERALKRAAKKRAR